MTDERTQEERVEAVRDAHAALHSALLNYQGALAAVGKFPSPEEVPESEAMANARIQIRILADTLVALNIHKAIWQTYLLTGRDPVIPDQDPPPKLNK